MSFMFEVYYLAPEDPGREARILSVVSAHDGVLDYRELPETSTGSICLTYDFAALEQAEAAAQSVQNCGEYVEGPYD